MFGLTGPQGNHGEDVKEYWWYLRRHPHSLLEHLALPLPPASLPVRRAGHRERGPRSKTEPEFELVDTGVFDDDRYWVVTVDYAKAGPHDLLMQITVENAGPDEATLHVVPHLWFRNTWSGATPSTTGRRSRRTRAAWSAAAPAPGGWSWSAMGTRSRCSARTRRTPSGSSASPARTPYPKDGINDHVVHGADTVNPAHTGTKAALHYVADRAGGRHPGGPGAAGGRPDEPEPRPVDVGPSSTR